MLRAHTILGGAIEVVSQPQGMSDDAVAAEYTFMILNLVKSYQRYRNEYLGEHCKFMDAYAELTGNCMGLKQIFLKESAEQDRRRKEREEASKAGKDNVENSRQ